MTESHAEVRSRERLVSDTFVMLTGGLSDDYDVADVLDRLMAACVELLGVSAAGMLLDDQAGGLAVMAASDDDARLLDLFQVQHDEGPCLEAARTAGPVVSADLRREHARWPVFAPAGLAAGFRAVTAVPLRLHGRTLGSLGLFQESPGLLAEQDQRLAQAFGDVATIGILQQRALQESAVLAEQLTAALTSRVLIEQAKGVLSARHDVSMADAFVLLRRHARDRNLKLTSAAAAVIEGRLVPAGG